MKISRYNNESICINHQMMITLHEQTSKKCCLLIQDYITHESHMEVVAKGEELVISDYNTTLVPVDFCFDSAGHPITTFEIKHDPAIVVHRGEVEVMQ